MKKSWAIISIIISALTAISVIVSLVLIFNKFHHQREVQERSYTMIE